MSMRRKILTGTARAYPPDEPEPRDGKIILFEIDSFDEYDLSSVEATVLGAPCTGSPNIGDAVTVYDEGECNFDPDLELVDLRGFAALLRVETFDENEYPTGTACRWVVFALCCPTS